MKGKSHVTVNKAPELMKEQILGIIYSAIENENHSLAQPISLEKAKTPCSMVPAASSIR